MPDPFLSAIATLKAQGWSFIGLMIGPEERVNILLDGKSSQIAYAAKVLETASRLDIIESIKEMEAIKASE
jgi:hypothetical protein